MPRAIYFLLERMRDGKGAVSGTVRIGSDWLHDADQTQQRLPMPLGGWDFWFHAMPSVREGERRERDKDRERDRDRHRETETDTETNRGERDREGGRERGSDLKHEIGMEGVIALIQYLHLIWQHGRINSENANERESNKDQHPKDGGQDAVKNIEDQEHTEGDRVCLDIFHLACLIQLPSHKDKVDNGLFRE
jgi:hypothetical protein